MGWNARYLVLPTALAVTTFAVVLACGGEDEPKKKSVALVPCAEATSSCTRCTDGDGKATCGPSSDCYLDDKGECHPGGSS